jgi:deoxyribodipyrimidine photolyase-related protein
MSDYCGGCRYDVKAKTGPNACPFNALYWDFLARNRDKLGGNVRLAMPYRNWDKMEDSAQQALLAQAAGFLHSLG